MWLKGSTDVTNLRDDVYLLLTGGMAAGQRGTGQAGNGATVSGADAWTGLDSVNKVVRSQRTESPYSGEQKQYRGMPRFAAHGTGTVFQSTTQNQLGKPTFSGTYNGVTARVYFACFVSTTNASPGSLASTVVTFTLVNADTGATVTSGTVTGWSGSTDTRVVTQGVSLTLTLGPSDQFVAGTNSVNWLRAYTTTHTDGIDYFPEAAKITTTSITVSNSSGGSNNYTGGGTDYTIVKEGHAFPSVSATIGFNSAGQDWGGTGCGCGIHWTTAGSPPAVGANYFIPDTYSIFGGYFQVPNVVTIASNSSLTGAPMDFWDATLAAGRHVLTSGSTPKTTLNTTQAFGQLFTGAPAGSTFINFWISVKQDKIVMVFRGDPGVNSGRIVTMTYQRMSSLQTADKHPWVFLPDGALVSSQGGGGFQVCSKYNYEQPYYGNPAVSIGSITLPSWFGPNVTGSNYRVITTGIVTTEVSATTGGLPDQNPNNWDLRWWLYSIYLSSNFGGANLVGTFDATRPSGIRGKLQGLFAVALDNFTTLDELADNTGTYLLVANQTAWGQNNAYGAIGILEE